MTPTTTPTTSTRRKPPPTQLSLRCEAALAAEADALVGRIAGSQLDIRTLVDSRAALLRLAVTRGLRSVAAELDAAGVPTTAAKRARRSSTAPGRELSPSPAPSPEAGDDNGAQSAGGDHADQR